MKAFHRLIGSVCLATSVLAQRITFLLLFMGAGLMLVQPCVGAPFTFEETGSLATVRNDHTATLLPNGTVLVAGGYDGANSLASAELYGSSERDLEDQRQPHPRT